MARTLRFHPGQQVLIIDASSNYSKYIGTVTTIMDFVPSPHNHTHDVDYSLDITPKDEICLLCAPDRCLMPLEGNDKLFKIESEIQKLVHEQ